MGRKRRYDSDMYRSWDVSYCGVIDGVLEFSDQEVLGHSLSDSAEDEVDEASRINAHHERAHEARRDGHSPSGSETEAGVDSSREEDDLEGWGRSKRDYYDHDEIEDEKDALEEEQEALRIQRRRLKQRTEADFGFDEAAWIDGRGSDKAGEHVRDQRVVTEVLPDLQLTGEVGVDARRRLLDIHHPEFLPLAKEFLDLQQLHTKLATENANAATLKYHTLNAYLGALSMYFALLTSTSVDGGASVLARSSSDIRDHSIMEVLVRCRQGWEEVKNMPASKHRGMHKVFEAKEAKADTDDCQASNRHVSLPVHNVKPTKPTRKRKRQVALEAARVEMENRRVQKLKRTEAELSELSLSVRPPRRQVTGPEKVTKGVEALRSGYDDSDFEEATVLDPVEAAEKARTKKTLRFYTSQIAQKAHRRSNAGRDAGGDADIPVRERLRDRQARLNAQAEKRGDQKGLSSRERLDMADGDDDRLSTDPPDGRAGGDEYYDMIATATKKRRAAQREAKLLSGGSTEGRVQESYQEAVGPDGKRAITFAIQKNKGLAPKRKKDVRNPRVKKRKKFAEKQKKLRSVRQVYNGGEQRGGYGGEVTGIKTGLVKSIKL